MGAQQALTETKITGLTALNVRAIREVFTEPGLVTTTATTATFHDSPQGVAALLMVTIDGLPGRGHPKASLHAVLRKVRRLYVASLEAQR